MTSKAERYSSALHYAENLEKHTRGAKNMSWLEVEQIEGAVKKVLGALEERKKELEEISKAFLVSQHTKGKKAREFVRQDSRFRQDTWTEDKESFLIHKIWPNCPSWMRDEEIIRQTFFWGKREKPEDAIRVVVYSLDNSFWVPAENIHLLFTER